MARLRREDGATIERLDEIRRELAPLGVKLDRWETGGDAEVAALLARPSLDDAGKERVLAAFDHRFRELPGYRARDLIVLEPATPGLDAGLAKFARCHRHDDDEVRYVVDGAGVFGFVRPDASQVALEVHAGDYIHVPAGTEHWFVLTPARRIKAVRYFVTTEGWVPRYTDTAIRVGTA